MTDPLIWLTISCAGLLGLMITAYAALIGWRGWLDLQRFQYERRVDRGGSPGPSPAARIEIADLKERVRKLEAIAAGVDI